MRRYGGGVRKVPWLTLPMKLQAELHLTRSGGSAGDGSGRAGRLVARSGGRGEDNEVGGIEIGAVQKVKDFRAKLQSETLPQGDVFQHREIPGGQSRADVSVAADVSVEAAGRWRSDKRRGIEPLRRSAQNHGATEIWIQERAHGIAGVAIVRRVVAELRREGESRLGGEDASYRPSADHPVAPFPKIARESLTPTERQGIERIHYRRMFHVKGRQTLVRSQIERIGDQAGSVARGGLVQGVAIVQSLCEGVDAAKGEAVAEALLQLCLQGVVGAVAAGEPRPGVGNARVGTGRLRRYVERSGGDGRSRQRRTDAKAQGGIVGWTAGIRRIVMNDGLARIKSRINGGAGSGGTNHRSGFVGVHADEFVIAVRADIPNGESGVR